jgi:digeranylgeranylglycerophospholipid reductase
MDLEEPDVVVVGLGPAGARAAAALATAGLEVLAIDRRRRAGVPVQCAEFVPMMIARDVEGVGATTTQLIRRMLTIVDQGEPEETPNCPGRIIDRARFDGMLAQEAAQEGATCRFATTLRGVTPDGTLIMSDGSACRPRLVIGADGPRSRIGAAIGEVNRHIVETRQVTVSLTRSHDATDIFLHADYRGGYGWLFPKGPLANVGVGVSLEDRQRLKPLLSALHAKLALTGRVGTRPSTLTGGVIPVGGRLCARGWIGKMPALLAGDAAGLTHPVTGAGIAAAVQSGTLAGRAAVEWLGGCRNALDAYEQELGDVFDVALARARRRRHETLTYYGSATRPDARALRAGWITSPHYWGGMSGQMSERGHGLP